MIANYIKYRRIRKKLQERELKELEEDLQYYLNFILQDIGIDLQIGDVHFEEEKNEDNNLAFIYETGNSLN